MDAGVVRQAASAIDSTARDLDRVVGSVNGLVGEIAGNWFGEAATEFHESWVHRHRGALTALVAALHDYAHKALTNADAQDRASAAAGVGAPMGGGPAGGSGGDSDPIERAREWEELLFTGLIGGFGQAIAAELHAAEGLFPEAARLGKIVAGFDKAGLVLGGVAIGIDGLSAVYDTARTGGTSDKTMNDELNLTLDSLALGVGVVNPLAGAAIGGVALGVDVLEHVNPELTADVFRLSGAGLGFEVVGATIDNIRRGDFNPIDIGSQVVHDETHAMQGLANDAAKVTDDAASWVGRTAGDAAKDVSHDVGGLVHGVSSWVHL